MRFKPIFALLLVLIIGVTPAPANSQETIELSAFDLVRIAVENIEQNEKLKNELVSFKRIYIEQELDRYGKFKSILNGPNGEATLHGKAYPANNREKENNSGFSINLNGILLSSYEYSLLNINDQENQKILEKYQHKPNGDLYRCTRCYILKFWPKANLPDAEEVAPPRSGLIESGIHEVAMHMEGIIYIDKDHLFIRRHRGQLNRGLNNYLVKATRASVDIEQELRQDLDKIIVINYAEFEYQIRIALIKYQTRKRIYRYHNYRLNNSRLE